MKIKVLPTGAIALVPTASELMTLKDYLDKVDPEKGQLELPLTNGHAKPEKIKPVPTFNDVRFKSMPERTRLALLEIETLAPQPGDWISRKDERLKTIIHKFMLSTFSSTITALQNRGYAEIVRDQTKPVGNNGAHHILKFRFHQP